MLQEFQLLPCYTCICCCLCHFSHFLLDVKFAFLMSSVGDSYTYSSLALETWVMENGFKTSQLQVPQKSVPKPKWSTESEAAFVKYRFQALLQTSGVSISRTIFWETTFSKNCLDDPLPCDGWEPIPSHFQTQCCLWYAPHRGFPGGSDGKESACNVGDLGSIPGSRRSPGEGNGNPLQYPCLENPMDRGAWWTMVCGITKGRNERLTLTEETSVKRI